MKTKLLPPLLLAVISTGSVKAALVTNTFVQNKPRNWTQETGATASQSSTNSTAVASRALDDNYNGAWSGNSVTHTLPSDTSPWWQVDLGAERPISEINLYNRTDCCGGRLSNFSVIASNDPSFASNVYDSGNQSSTVGVSASYTGIGATARYVRVSRNSLSNTNETVISLAEVEVLGSAAFAYTNLALVSTASQSSTLNNTAIPAANKAIDGNLTRSFGSGSTTHTAGAGGQPVFWETILESPSQINEIALYNRGDCCQGRLSNFRLSVFDGATEVWGENYFEGTGAAGNIFSIQEDSGGFFATGDRVRIELLGGLNNDGNDTLSLREVEIFGAVVIPEPAGISMLGLAGLALIARRRRHNP